MALGHISGGSRAMFFYVFVGFLCCTILWDFVSFFVFCGILFLSLFFVGFCFFLCFLWDFVSFFVFCGGFVGFFFFCGGFCGIFYFFCFFVVVFATYFLPWHQFSCWLFFKAFINWA